MTISDKYVIMNVPASPDGNTEGGENVVEMIKAILSILNSIGAGVIANYISKRLDSNSTGKNKKH